MTRRDANSRIGTLIRLIWRLLLTHVIASYIVVPPATAVLAAVELDTDWSEIGTVLVILLFTWMTSPFTSVWLMGLGVIAMTGGWHPGDPALPVMASLACYWVVFALVFRWLSARRRLELRREQGLCLHCGYDLRASPERCPECGTPVPQHMIRKPMA